MSTNIAPTVKKRKATSPRAPVVRPAARRLSHQTRKVVNDVRELGGVVSDATEGELAHLRHNAAEYWHQSQRGVSNVWQACRQRIRDRPYNSILIAASAGVIAAGAGWLLGRLWKHR